MMVAEVCDKEGLKEEAVEFYIIAGKKDEAFTIAQTSACMDIFVQTLVDQQKPYGPEDAVKVAAYYESMADWQKAAQNYERANNSTKALKLYQKVAFLKVFLVFLCIFL